VPPTSGSAGVARTTAPAANYSGVNGVSGSSGDVCTILGCLGRGFPKLLPLASAERSGIRVSAYLIEPAPRSIGIEQPQTSCVRPAGEVLLVAVVHQVVEEGVVELRDTALPAGFTEAGEAVVATSTATPVVLALARLDDGASSLEARFGTGSIQVTTRTAAGWAMLVSLPAPAASERDGVALSSRSPAGSVVGHLSFARPTRARLEVLTCPGSPSHP
jgi:hypothetical protein